MKENELESFADEYVTEVFTPLYETDLFILEQFKDYPAIYDALIQEMIEDWTIPNETQRIVEHDIEKYCPYQD